jgi:hypothetical protein
MLTEQNLTEYLDEIRDEVCSRCTERPQGGPPCEPLGKFCGVEMHLPQLVDSIHAVNSRRIAPYLAHNRLEICAHCDFLHSSICPCPMDYLAVLVVRAVDTVDQRRAREEKVRQLCEGVPEGKRAGLETICRAYAEATGKWTGCDWSTHFGRGGLDLEDLTADEAEARAVEGGEAVEDWLAAAKWLAKVEHHAKQAEVHAAEALRAARAGQWDQALRQAEYVWALEFATGRPFRKGTKPAWRDFLLAVGDACPKPTAVPAAQ